MAARPQPLPIYSREMVAMELPFAAVVIVTRLERIPHGHRSQRIVYVRYVP